MSNNQGGIERENEGEKNEKSPEVPEEPIGDLINNLNNDCLVKIFQYLSIRQRIADIALVCKRWRDVMELAWNDIKTLEFTYDNRNTSEPRWKNQKNVEKILKKCGHHLTELKFSTRYCDTKVLTVIEQYCENLKKLEIEDIDTNNFIELLPNLPKLKYFKMHILAREWPEHFLNALPHETLTELDLYKISTPADFFCADKFGNFTKLRSLTLLGIVLETHIMEVISQKSSLTFLTLDGCHLMGDISLLTRLTNLELLDLTNVPGPSDKFLIELSNACKYLKYLKIRGCSLFTDIGLTSLHQLPHLEELFISSNRNITHGPLITMFNLKKLECRYCRGVKEDGIFALMRHSPNLTDLDITLSEVNENFITTVHEIAKQRTNNIPLRLKVYNLTQRRDNKLRYADSSPLLDIQVIPISVFSDFP